MPWHLDRISVTESPPEVKRETVVTLNLVNNYDEKKTMHFAAKTTEEAVELAFGFFFRNGIPSEQIPAE